MKYYFWFNTIATILFFYTYEKLHSIWTKYILYNSFLSLYIQIHVGEENARKQNKQGWQELH